MATDWILRVGDGKNLKNSSKFKIWGILSTNCDCKYMLNNVKCGDRLWFVTKDSQGKIIAVATYNSHNKRELGTLLNMTLSNEDLGWNGDGCNSDTEIHYTDLYDLSDCDLLSNIKSPKIIRTYNEKCNVELPVEYKYIIRYRKSVNEL